MVRNQPGWCLGITRLSHVWRKLGPPEAIL